MYFDGCRHRRCDKSARTDRQFFVRQQWPQVGWEKKKHAGSKLACLLPWYSHHVWCHSNAIATKKGKASLALRSFDVDEERARTAARKKWKNGPCAPLRVLSDEKFLSLWPTGAFLRRLEPPILFSWRFFPWIWIVTYLQKRSQVWNGVQMPSWVC